MAKIMSAAEAAIGLAKDLLARLADVVTPLVLRIALALPFLRSGLTRWEGFLSLSPSTVYLFQNSFKLHILGRLYAFPAPVAAAFLVGLAEITLPILLMVGLVTRLTAFCLLVMTGVIQLVFPDGWANFHLYWAALALAIIVIGPGALSVDYVLSVMVRSIRLRAV